MSEEKKIRVPTSHEMLQAFRDQLCPWCGCGPFRVLALHTFNAHGITSATLREIAGIPRTTSKVRTTSEATRRGQVERAKRLIKEGSLRSGGAYFTERHYSAAGKRALIANSSRVGSSVGNREETKQRIIEMSKQAEHRKRCALNGRNNLGRKHGPMSEEHKQKISAAKKGVPRSPEVVQGMRNRAVGRIITRDASTGRIVSWKSA